MKTLAKIAISASITTSFTILVLAFYIALSYANGQMPFVSKSPNQTSTKTTFFNAIIATKNQNIKSIENTKISQNLDTNSVFLSNFNNTFVQSAQTTSTEEKYAKARENCILYLTSNISDQSLDNTLFQIPEGYFVRLLNTNNSDAYEVAYGSITGYVIPTTVKRVSFLPTIAYLDSQILITKSDGAGTVLRYTASANSEQVALIPAASKVEYIASLNGEKPTDGLSPIWYYVRYFPEQEPTKYYEGYIYSERLESQPIIPPNNEDEPIKDISTTLLPEDNNIKSNFPLWLKTLVISILCLPAILFMIYIIVSIKKRKQNQHTL